jgi:glycosidase
VRIAQTGDQWWKNAVVYCLDVETYLDSDGDGVGDFAACCARSTTWPGSASPCLWLMPFQPDPEPRRRLRRADYYAVDQRLGTLGDVVELVRTATTAASA